MTTRRKMTDADRLRELITAARLSQVSFARVLGISERQVRYWVADDPVPPWVFLAAEHLAHCEATRADREQREAL